MGESAAAVPAAVATATTSAEAVKTAAPSAEGKNVNVAATPLDKSGDQAQAKDAKGEEKPNEQKSESESTADNADGATKEQALAVQQLVQDLAELTDEPQVLGLPNVAREGLAQVAAGGDLSEAFIARGDQLIDHPEDFVGKPSGEDMTPAEKNARIALGYDMKIGGLQIRQRQLSERYHEANDKNKAIIQKEYDSVVQELKELQEARGNKDLPRRNQLAGFAKLFGAEDEAAQAQPLVEVEFAIEQAIRNKSYRKNFIKGLQGSDDLQTEEGQDLVKNLNSFLEKASLKRSIDKVSKLALKISLGSLLAALMMMWVSRQEKKQGM